jgi:hypothetical protein
MQDSNVPFKGLNTKRVTGTAIAVTVGVVVPLATEAPAVAESLDNLLLAPAVNPSQAETTETADNLAAIKVMQAAAHRPEAQAKVAFSSTPNSTPNSTCETAACQGITFIDAKLPELEARVADLRSQMQQFQAAYTAQNLETHQAILANRTVELTQQKAELGQQISEVESQLVETQTLLALQPYEASFADQLLADNPTYQQALQELEVIDQQIALEFSFPDLNEAKLRGLYDSYHQVVGNLRQEAQRTLGQYLANAAIESPNPLWQETMYRDLLQSLMDNTHQAKVLAVRQETILQAEQLLQQRRTELSSLLRTYAGLQQQLEVQTRILQEYVVKRQALEQAMAQPSIVAPAMRAPQMATATPTITPWLMMAKLPADLQEEIALALLVSGALVMAWSRRQTHEPRYKDYQLLLSATPEPAFFAATHRSQTVLTHVQSPLEPPCELSEQAFLAPMRAPTIAKVQPATRSSSDPSLPQHSFPEHSLSKAIQDLDDIVQPSEQLNQPAMFPTGLSPVALPIDDIDLFADEAIAAVFSQFDFVDQVVESQTGDLEQATNPVVSGIVEQRFSRLPVIV